MDDPTQGAAGRILADIDRELAWARADLAEVERLTQRLEHTRRHAAAVVARVRELDARMRRERRDVDELQGLSLSALLERLFGDVEQRRQEELEQWLVARLKLEQAEHELQATKASIDVLQRHLASRADPREAYHRLLAEKTLALADSADAQARHAHRAERHGVLLDALREIEEAAWAGQVAKAALTGVLHALSRAQSLGKLDMLGLSSNWVKFEHIDDAHRHASAANRALSRFQMELADVQARHDAHLTFDISQLATFADYFFDDLVSDWIVQRRIDRSHASAGIARTRVNRTLRVLARRQHEITLELRRIGASA